MNLLSLDQFIIDLIIIIYLKILKNRLFQIFRSIGEILLLVRVRLKGNLEEIIIKYKVYCLWLKKIKMFFKFFVNNLFSSS